MRPSASLSPDTSVSPDGPAGTDGLESPQSGRLGDASTTFTEDFAEEPAADSAQGAAADSAKDSAEDRVVEIGEGSAEEAAGGSIADVVREPVDVYAAKDPAPDPAEGPATDSGESVHEPVADSAEGVAADFADDAPEDSGEDRAAEFGASFAEEPVAGSGEGLADGPAGNFGDGSAEETVTDSAEAPAADFVEDPSPDAAGDAAGDPSGADDPRTDHSADRVEQDSEQQDSEEQDHGEQDHGEQVTGDGERVREIPLPEPVSAALTGALNQLRVAVKELHFGLDIPGSDEARKAQAAVLAQLDDYVIPRVHLSTAPALIVVAGSTGAGKSTLVNTLAGQKISVTGVRRPTTSVPVLACHPDDREWYAEGGLLGGLTKLDAQPKEPVPDGIVLIPIARLPQGVALLDTPDIDSVIEQHQETAYRMLDAADLWVFVTTAARYADAPSWGLLRRAKERGARMAIVLSRVPEKSRDVIVKHFGRMLDEYGLGEAERFVISETTVSDGRLPDAEITELRMWLAELSIDDERRAEAVKSTLNGVFNSFKVRLPALARHLETQVALRADLRSDVEAAYMGALADIDEATGNGSLLRGEVLARWQDFAGSGDLMRVLQLRRGAKGQHKGPERVRTLKAALRTGLESVVVSAAHRAAEDVVARWRQRAGAGDRLAAMPGLGRPSDEVARRTSRTITAWQEHVSELIRTEGVTKRSVARLVSFDAESLSLIFTVSLLGYGAADPPTGSGAGALPQRLLRSLLGAESLRSINAKARSDLRARLELLFDEETFRYLGVLDSAGIPDEAAATRLYQATYNLEVAR